MPWFALANGPRGSRLVFFFDPLGTAGLLQDPRTGDSILGARTKLNAAYLNGALLVASAIGLGLHSWTAFIVTIGLLIALQTVAGGIRPGT